MVHEIPHHLLLKYIITHSKYGTSFENLGVCGLILFNRV